MVKKIIMLLGFCFVLSCREYTEQITPIKENTITSIRTFTFKESGCNYTVLYYPLSGGVTVINTTKDSLEVEYYKSQIDVDNKYFFNE